jgi:hypothetical protein
MNIIFNKPKGWRIRKSYPKPYFIEPVDSGWVYNIKLNKWVTYSTSVKDEGYSSALYVDWSLDYKGIYSLKAVIRLVRKWNLKGVWFRVSSFVGNDI